MRCFRIVSALCALVAVSASAPIAAPVGVSAQSLCNKYSAALNISQTGLITALVARAVLGTTAFNADADAPIYSNETRSINANQVTGIVFVPILQPFFTGGLAYDLNKNPNTGALLNRSFVNSYLSTRPGSGVTADGGAIFLELAGKLVSFFAQPGALNCSEYPAYAGAKTMKAAHNGMNINQTVFDAFNGQIAAAFTSFGGSTPDANAAGALLASFGRNAAANEICTDASCTSVTASSASGSTATTGGSTTGGSTTGGSTATNTPAGSTTGGSTAAGTSSGAVVVPSMAIAAVALVASLAL